METTTVLKPDGKRIAAIELVSSAHQALVIVCHGFRGRKENRDRIFGLAQRLNQIGYGVIAFDFLGSGDSDGDFADISLSGQADDLKVIIDYVCTKYSLPVFLLGRSFGGSTVLVGGAGDDRIKGYIFWSTPVFLAETFKAILGEYYLRLKRGETVHLQDDYSQFYLGPQIVADFDQHNIDKLIGKLGNRPVLIIHGENDQTVNKQNAHYLHSRALNSELVLVKDADHSFTNQHHYRETITINWLTRLTI